MCQFLHHYTKPKAKAFPGCEMNWRVTLHKSLFLRLVSKGESDNLRRDKNQSCLIMSVFLGQHRDPADDVNGVIHLSLMTSEIMAM